MTQAPDYEHRFLFSVVHELLSLPCMAWGGGSMDGPELAFFKNYN